MAARKGGLSMGKGLESLIPSKIKKQPETVTETITEKEAVKAAKADEPAKSTAVPDELSEGAVIEVKISSVVPNSDQPRKEFNDAALSELSESISKFGVIQPLLVRKNGRYYEIIAGERRWRAAKLAGLKKVPVLVKDYTQREVLEVALIENLQREDLNPIEEAMAYQKLIEDFELKQEEVAERVSKSRSAVANSMRLLKLHEKVQKMLVDDVISTGHARCLLGLEDKEMQAAAADRIIAANLSVRETEKLIKRMKNPLLPAKKALSEQMVTACKNYEDELEGILGTKVSLHHKASGRGTIEISYGSLSELDRIRALLGKKGDKE